MINRKLQIHIRKRFFKGKVIAIMGPRQSGKTVLARRLTKEFTSETIWLNADESDVRQMFTNQTVAILKQIIGNKKIVVIDEAQRIINIGLVLKLFADNFKEIQVIATGSSSFDLSNEINEPLTGRKYEHTLLPFSFQELVENTNWIDQNRLLEQRLIYGSYPEVITTPGEEEELLANLSDSYLYKDIFTLENIKKPAGLENLLKALAFQVGSEVVTNELAKLTGMSGETVERYIVLLEKAFIVFRLPSLNRNLRNEIKKNKKIYFYDNGIRNSIIKNFNQISMRDDVGKLWENYLVSERVKYNHYNKIDVNKYFWRTHTQQEIDYIEEYDGKLHAYEFKWSTRKKVKFPATFIEAYSNSETNIINRENYFEWLND
ncbi:MAG: ATP-binding protein [Bacteroidota bacterium]